MMRTLIIIYRRAKLIISVNDDMESIPERMPLREKTLRLFSDREENISTKLEKDTSIFFPYMFCPREQMKFVISDVVSIT